MADETSQWTVEFGERLAVARVRAGLTQQALADLVGVAKAESISRYERGLREPRLGTVIRLARALDVQVSTLVPGEARWMQVRLHVGGSGRLEQGEYRPVASGPPSTSTRRPNPDFGDHALDDLCRRIEALPEPLKSRSVHSLEAVLSAIEMASEGSHSHESGGRDKPR